LKRIKSDKIFINQLFVEALFKYAESKKIKFSPHEEIWGFIADKLFQVHGGLSKAKINNDKEFQSAAVWLVFDFFLIRRGGVYESSQFLEKLGYDAFRDDSNIGAGGIIYPEEPAQVGFLHKNAFKVVDSYVARGGDDFNLYYPEIDMFEKVINKHGYKLDPKTMKRVNEYLKDFRQPKRKPK
ncbi:MAG: hypothetical protein ACO2ZZ_14685, partial [Cyclobacteriaceae bacterium]